VTLDAYQWHVGHIWYGLRRKPIGTPTGMLN